MACIHASEVRHGQANYIQLIGKNAREDMHHFGTFRVQSDIIFRGLTTGQSRSRYAVLAGHVDHEPSRHGAAYSDQYGDWQNVIVQANCQITLTKYVSEASTTEDQIKL